jgi:rhamnosyltransferase
MKRKGKNNLEFHSQKRQVFCIGCKGIPAEYGGFETFVENLTLHRISDKIRYHVARVAHDNERYEYNGAKCYNVKVREIGPGKAIVYDMRALKRAIDYCRERPEIKDPVFFIMACRIGFFMGRYKRQIEELGGKFYLNPDGHDWARRKWSLPVRLYWKMSERLMVRYADRIICDSREIEKYIRKTYKRYKPNTTYIAYGADLSPSKYSDDDSRYKYWLSEHDTQPQGYYLVVGRFVQENNFDHIIKEFMQSESKRKLIIITTPNERLMGDIDNRLHFSDDPRIVFADSVYDKELLKKIRENAYAYIHGHEVGGTNPSLLEALASTNMNLIFDVSYNREVAGDATIYWIKGTGNLASTINRVDDMDEAEIARMGVAAKKRIRDGYTWEAIARGYEKEFLK